MAIFLATVGLRALTLIHKYLDSVQYQMASFEAADRKPIGVCWHVLALLSSVWRMVIVVNIASRLQPKVAPASGSSSDKAVGIYPPGTSFCISRPFSVPGNVLRSSAWNIRLPESGTSNDKFIFIPKRIARNAADSAKYHQEEIYRFFEVVSVVLRHGTCAEIVAIGNHCTITKHLVIS